LHQPATLDAQLTAAQEALSKEKSTRSTAAKALAKEKGARLTSE
jgi:chromosome segregation ATPase